MIVDSFAWIELVGGTKGETFVRERLGEADLVLTPDLVLAEVARKLSRDRLPGPVVRRKLEDIAVLSGIVPVTVPIALGVHAAESDLRAHAKARRLDPPGLADALILATARDREGKVLTGDPHFLGLRETLWLET